VGYVAQRDPAVVAAERQSQAEFDRAFRQNLAQIVALAEMPEEALREMGPEGPDDPRRYVRRATSREASRLLGRLSPELQQELADGLPVSTPMSSLAPAGRDGLQALVDAFSSDPVRAGSPNRQIDLEDGGAWTIAIRPMASAFNAKVSGFVVRVSSPGTAGFGAGVTVPVPHPDLNAPWTFELPGDLPESRNPAFKAIMPEGYGSSSPNWESVFTEFSAVSNVPVVSDAYRLYPGDIVRNCEARPEQRLEGYLDYACRFWLRRWGSFGPVVAFQRVDRPIVLATQIPESLLRKWKQQVIAAGAMNVADMVEFGSLTNRQLGNLETVMGAEAPLVVRYRHAWRLWGGLTEAQRDRALNGGQRISELSRPMLELVGRLPSIGQAVGSPRAAADRRVRASITKEEFLLELTAEGKPQLRIQIDLRVPPQRVAQLKQQEEQRVASLRAMAARP